VVDTLVKAIDIALKDPEVAKKLGDIAVKPQMITGAAFTEYLTKERKLIGGVVTAAGIKPE
jgi:tripartite-type tricarboxylate transporter receptor subunit TctC